jgi:hypothetical protein
MMTITLEMIGGLLKDNKKRLARIKKALLIEILNNILNESCALVYLTIPA